MKNKLAIFDIDGTIFRSSLLIELVNKLIEQKIFPTESEKDYINSLTNWLDRNDSYEMYIKSVVNSFNNNIKGVHYADFNQAAKEVVNENKDRSYIYTKNLIKKLKTENYFLVAISHSPKTILDQFCQYLGFDKIYGRLYELGPEGRFTGKTIDEHLIANKANIVKRVLEKNNLDLKDSIGVGDTESDIPFLEMVEKPICFNPNYQLYRYAKINNWQIVVERKDVIYKI